MTQVHMCSRAQALKRFFFFAVAQVSSLRNSKFGILKIAFVCYISNLHLSVLLFSLLAKSVCWHYYGR